MLCARMCACARTAIGMRNVSMLQEALEECESNGLGNLILPAGGIGQTIRKTDLLLTFWCITNTPLADGIIFMPC